MKIAISARHLKHKPDDGTSRFTCEVIKRLVVNNPGHEFVLIFDRKYDDLLIFGPNCEGVVVSPETRHPFLWYYRHEMKLPEILKKIRPELQVCAGRETTFS
jgi:hypothetical protein